MSLWQMLFGGFEAAMDIGLGDNEAGDRRGDIRLAGPYPGQIVNRPDPKADYASLHEQPDGTMRWEPGEERRPRR